MNLEWRAGLHGANHAVINILPLYLMCGQGDVAAECINPYEKTKYRPERILLYDTHPGLFFSWTYAPSECYYRASEKVMIAECVAAGGIGLAPQACRMFGLLLEKAYELVRDCKCTGPAGCPGCIQHTKCPEYNTILCKRASEVILKGVLLAEGYPFDHSCTQ